MYRSALRIHHPVTWHASLPKKTWTRELDPDTGELKWVPTFRPELPQHIAPKFENYFYAAMMSHALRLLNAELDPLAEYDPTEPYDPTNPDPHRYVMFDVIVGDLRRQAPRKARRVGIRFAPGRSRPRHIMEGVLSEAWLDRAIHKATERAIEHWDQQEAQRRHDDAVTRGRKPRRRTRRFTPADLPAGSITAQGEALNVSRSTIARLRREARHALNDLDVALALVQLGDLRGYEMLAALIESALAASA